MKKAERCRFSPKLIVSFYLHQLKPKKLGEVKNHLKSCPRCRAKLVALEVGTQIAAAMRKKVGKE